jgi:glucose-6-phosphate 1-epimerase
MQTMQATDKLNQEFGIANALRFDTSNGMMAAIVTTPKAEATLYLQGAHLAAWTPSGHRSVLFLSSRSRFESGKAIRGGVPLIFPWFNARGDGLPGPPHGFARTTIWTVESASLEEDNRLVLSLRLLPNETSRGYGFDDFELRFRVSVGQTLQMELQTRNQSRQPLTIREALHTYFAVSDVRQASVTGLEGTAYNDHTDGDIRKQQPALPVRVSGETDMLFVGTESACTIEDPGWRRRIVIEKSGSRSTVVWNPWVEKAAHMADLGEGEWQRMLCVESANAAENAVTIEPQQSQTLSAMIRVEEL